MQELSLEALLAALAERQWSTAELSRLRGWLASVVHPGECLALIGHAARGRPCPHCGCTRMHRCGFASGSQRFRCLGCRCTFNALTGTPLARLRKRECWLPYLQCLIESRTVRDAAQVAGVHRTTSFRWRHRFVPGAARDRPPRKRGGVTKRRGINREHDCILVARDRTGQTLDVLPGRGPVTVAHLHKCLRAVLPADVLLISDAARAYRCSARQAGIMHEFVNVASGQRARGAIHVQNVNGWHSRFKSWLVRFRGVASRYLAHYSGWQRLLDAKQLRTPDDWLRTAVRHG